MKIQANKILKIVLVISIFLIAVSVFYKFLLDPFIRNIKLNNCLDNIKEKQNATAKEYTRKSSDNKSAYEVLKENLNENIPSINTQKETEECYRRYK